MFFLDFWNSNKHTYRKRVRMVCRNNKILSMLFIRRAVNTNKISIIIRLRGNKIWCGGITTKRGNASRRSRSKYNNLFVFTHLDRNSSRKLALVTTKKARIQFSTSQQRFQPPQSHTGWFSRLALQLGNTCSPLKKKCLDIVGPIWKNKWTKDGVPIFIFLKKFNN